MDLPTSREITSFYIRMGPDRYNEFTGIDATRAYAAYQAAKIAKEDYMVVQTDAVRTTRDPNSIRYEEYRMDKIESVSYYVNQ